MKIQLKPLLQWQPKGPINLQWENACHHHNSFGFDRLFLKRADKVGMDGISDSSENWPGRINNFIGTKTILFLDCEKASV